MLSYFPHNTCKCAKHLPSTPQGFLLLSSFVGVPCYNFFRIHLGGSNEHCLAQQLGRLWRLLIAAEALLTCWTCVRGSDTPHPTSHGEVKADSIQWPGQRPQWPPHSNHALWGLAQSPLTFHLERSWAPPLYFPTLRWRNTWLGRELYPCQLPPCSTHGCQGHASSYSSFN